MVVLNVLFLILGLVIGARVGLRGLAMFCYSIGLMCILIRVPTYLYKKVASPFYEFVNPATANMIALLVLFLVVVTGAIQLGWQMTRSRTLVLMPEGIDQDRS